MLRRSAIVWLVVGIILAALLPGSQPAQAQNAAVPPEPFRYFPETGHNISWDVKQFYDHQGGLPIFGLPLTEVIDENGQQVQYFERARFEIHPENKGTPYYILLTRLGAHFTLGREQEPAFQWRVDAPGPDLEFYAESGHSLGGGFRDFWKNNGGVQSFGFPISEEFAELNQADGQTYTVQYFERARFEWHSGDVWPVQLGLLGSEYARQINLDPRFTAGATPIIKLGTATTYYRGSSSERVNNIARAASQFNGQTVKAGQTASFLKMVGDLSTEAGYSDGYAIVNGKLEKVVGGGLCQVSTTLYRAVFNAGLPIVERYGHTYIVYYYENILGFDATVFSPDVDMRWRNDLKTDILITTDTDTSSGRVTFNLWGYSDGRSARMEGPSVSNERKPGAPVWQYDKTMRRGTVEQLVHGRSGMDVTMYRVVTRADGTATREKFFTRYLPWEDFFIYGPGVTPPQGTNIIAPRYP